MGVCCSTSNEEIIHEEIIHEANEVKKETKFSGYETKETDDRFNTANQSVINEKIIFEIQDNPLEDISKAIFQKLNEMRTNPIKFFNKSSQYYLNDFISQAVTHKPKPIELIWSTKKEGRISKYFQLKCNKSKSNHQKILEINELFEQDYNVYGYYSNGNVARLDDIIWTLVSSSKDSDRKRIFFNDYSYCVIYTDVFINEENVVSYFFFFQVK